VDQEGGSQRVSMDGAMGSAAARAREGFSTPTNCGGGQGARSGVQGMEGRGIWAGLVGHEVGRDCWRTNRAGGEQACGTPRRSHLAAQELTRGRIL